MRIISSCLQICNINCYLIVFAFRTEDYENLGFRQIVSNPMGFASSSDGISYNPVGFFLFPLMSSGFAFIEYA